MSAHRLCPGVCCRGRVAVPAYYLASNGTCIECVAAEQAMEREEQQARRLTRVAPGTPIVRRAVCPPSPPRRPLRRGGRGCAAFARKAGAAA